MKPKIEKMNVIQCLWAYIVCHREITKRLEIEEIQTQEDRILKYVIMLGVMIGQCCRIAG